MKKIIVLLITFALITNASAQLKVNSSGQVGIGTASPQYRMDVTGDARITGNVYLGSASNFFCTTASNVPITLKVNNTLAGFTGHSTNSNVSFGYGTLPNITNGLNNTVIGNSSLSNNTTGSRNTAVGDGSMLTIYWALTK